MADRKTNEIITGAAGSGSRETTDFGPDGATGGEAPLPVEQRLELFVNDIHLVTFHCTPEHLEELVRGFLRGHGYVDPSVRILSVEQRLDSGRIDVSLSGALADCVTDLPADKAIYTGCGQASLDSDAQLTGDRGSVSSVAATMLRHALETVLRHGELYRRTRGVHSAGLFSIDGKPLVLREDIGRHNALDKVLGWLSEESYTSRDTFIASSGRVSSEAVNKCVRMGIPVLVSKGVPTTLAVENAHRLGLTLGSSLGPARLRVYSHRYRVTG